ncbi:MAG: translation initiation factor IF-2 N-terminal domain-containing protein, partial [Acidobacteriaceae bacterium]
MSKVRINDLARELEVKSRVILDILPEVGVTEKKTHSSSVEEDEARRVRAALGRGGKSASNAPARATAVEQKPKIDLSHISQPGDVLRAIQQQKEQRETHGTSRGVMAAPPRPTVTSVAAGAAKPTVSAPAASSQGAVPAGNKPATAGTPVSAAPSVSVSAGAQAGSKPAPRRIVPLPRQAPQIVTSTTPATPAIASRAPQGPVIVKPPSSGLAAASTVVAVPAKSAPQEAKPATPVASSISPVAPRVPQAPPAAVEMPPAPVATVEPPIAASSTSAPVSSPIAEPVVASTVPA